MTTRQRRYGGPRGLFIRTCVRCGFRGTRGVEASVVPSDYPNVTLPGLCKHRGACERRQTKEGNRA